MDHSAKYIKSYKHWELVVDELEAAYLNIGTSRNVGQSYIVQCLSKERTALFEAFPDYGQIWVKNANNSK